MRRRVLHRRAGEALATHFRPDPDAVAFHFARAHDPRVALWLVVAGERAENAYAYLTAADRFERALAGMEEVGSEGQRGWLLVRLGILYRFVDIRRALAYLEAAGPSVTAAADPVLSAYALTCQGLVRCFGGNVGAGLTDLAAGVRAIQELPAEERTHPAIPMCVRLAFEEGDGETTLIAWRGVVGRFAEARSLGERLVAHDATRALGDAYAGLLYSYARLGLAAQARESGERAREAYHRLSNHRIAYTASVVTMTYVLLPYYADDVPARRRAQAEAKRDWERMTGTLTAEDVAPLSRLRRGESDLLEGEWEGMEEAARTLIERSGALGGLRGAIYICLGTIARARGNRAVAWGVVRRALPQRLEAKPGDGVFHETLFAQKLAAGLALDAGDLSTAKAWLAWSGAVLGQSEGQVLWAQYSRQADDIEQALAYAERALARATEPRQPLALLAAHRLLGERTPMPVASRTRATISMPRSSSPMRAPRPTNAP